MSMIRRILMLEPWDDSTDVETYPPEHPLRKARLRLVTTNVFIAMLTLLVGMNNTDLAGKLLLVLIGTGALIAAVYWHTGLKARGANILFANAMMAVFLYFVLAAAQS